MKGGLVRPLSKAAIIVMALAAAVAQQFQAGPSYTVNSLLQELKQARLNANRKQRNQIVPLGILSFAGLLLTGLLWAGCATSQSYPGPVHGLTFNGTVQSIDVKDHRLTVAPLKPGEPTVFVWESTTQFWKNGIPIQPELLEPTWPVRVHYHETSGQLITHHVYVQAAYPVVH